MDGTNLKLWEIGTQWKLVLEAGKSQGEGPRRARQELLIRYHRAVQAFFRARIRDEHVADELYSRFAERVLEIHPFLRKVREKPGQKKTFRAYLARVLRYMIADYYREQQRLQSKELAGGDLVAEAAAPPETSPCAEEALFRECWKKELINQVWDALKEREQRTGLPYCTLVQLKVAAEERGERPRTSHLADALRQQGRSLSLENVRQVLHRGTKMFSELLIDEVARSLRRRRREVVTTDRIVEEMSTLGIFYPICRKALELRNE